MKKNESSAKLPYTPADTLDLTDQTREEMNRVIADAKATGRWKLPSSEAATDFTEMNLEDIFYWVYKSENPITEMQGIRYHIQYLQRDSSIVKLPAGFQKHTSMTLAAVGDLLQAPGLQNSENVLYKNIADKLFHADISIANYESPVVATEDLVPEVIGDKQGAPLECSDLAQFKVLTHHHDMHFTMLNTANNHAFDMGVEGLLNTQKILKNHGIENLGTYADPNDHGKPKIMVVNGIKIGFVSCTFGLNGHEKDCTAEELKHLNIEPLLPRSGKPETGLLKMQIDDCKSQNCDFIIANIHSGFEFEMFPRDCQIDMARELAEYGVDLILGNHPHVIQPVEYISIKRDNGRIVPVAHSLGSVTWGHTAEHLVLSLIQNFTITKGTLDGKEITLVERAETTPIFRSVTYPNGEPVTRLEKLSDHVDGRSQTHDPEYINRIAQYARHVLGS